MPQRWRWKDDDVVHIYALEDASTQTVYVGAAMNVPSRVRNHPITRRSRTLTVLEVTDGLHALDREDHWHGVYRERGWTTDSHTNREGNKIAGAKRGPKVWAKLTDEQKLALHRSGGKTGAGGRVGGLRGGKIGGPKAYAQIEDKFAFHAVGGRASGKVRFSCNGCGHESTGAGIAQHQKSRTCDEKTRIA